jgi:hypothetical protein
MAALLGIVRVSAIECGLPKHGRISCERCFNGQAEWGRSIIEEGGWRLLNNPMAWGAQDPKYLVLGFSKGSRQADLVLTAPHDEVPYVGFRDTLTAQLRLLGLMSPEDTVDQRIRECEADWAFGSVVRCTVEKQDPLTGKFEKAGNVVAESARRGAGRDWIGQCLSQHLSSLPPRLEVVVMLSNDDGYVGACFERVGRLHAGVRRVNDVAYADGRTLWVHVVHPSGSSGRHIPHWLEGARNRQGDKMRMAKAAVAARLRR